MSWTGSETKRRPQGTCKPPASPSNLTAKYTIPAGTLVLVKAVCSTQDWKDHETKVELGFERYETRNRAGRTYEFRHEGYFLRIRNKDIKYRDPPPSQR